MNRGAQTSEVFETSEVSHKTLLYSISSVEGETLIPQIRVATRADAGEISRLLETAVYRHIHADWYLPGDWLGTKGFVLIPKPVSSPISRAAQFVGGRQPLLACLAAGADVMPVAWVRIAALSSQLADSGNLLAAMMARITPHLQQRGVTQLAWMAASIWTTDWLEKMGFVMVNQVEAYVKEDTAVPPTPTLPQLTIRPATLHDMDILADIETATFAPIWRHSAHALRLAFHQSLSFDVAEWEGTAVAFQISALGQDSVHLVRLTVHPKQQGQGVGSALLAHAIRGYHQAGLHTITLNTQIDNVSSHILYRKFGFQPTNHQLPVWLKELDHDPI